MHWKPVGSSKLRQQRDSAKASNSPREPSLAQSILSFNKIILQKTCVIKNSFTRKANKKDCWWKAIVCVKIVFPRSESILTAQRKKRKKACRITNINSLSLEQCFLTKDACILDSGMLNLFKV